MDEMNFVNRNGVINEKRLLRILYSGQTVNRVKSVSNPPAQNNKLYPVKKDEEEILKILESAKSILKRKYGKVYYIFVLQELNGLRVSEVLNIRSIDITSTGLARIKGLKGSKDRVVTTGEAKEYLLRCKRLNLVPFEGIDRFYVYRVYKQVGINFNFGDNRKNSVTHSFRHILVKSMREQNFDLFTQKEFIGHKYESNTLKYGKDQKKLNGR